MNSLLQTIPEPLRSWLPYGAVFLIVFAIVFNSLLDAAMFNRRTTVIVSLCVSVLGLYGLDVIFIRSLLILYGSLSSMILVVLAVLVLALWIMKVLRKGS
jgi:hypothetical protein